MLFNSFVFIFIFFPLTFLFYFGLNRLGHHAWAKASLVLASLYFYAYFNWTYLPIMLSSILVNFAIGRGLLTCSRPLIRKSLLVLGVGFNLSLLGYFKYTDFAIDTFNTVFHTQYPLLHILLPLGISFFTFQQMSFVIDAYKNGIGGVRHSFLDYSNFVSFFPQLIAGPIVLPEEMLPQFEDPSNAKPQYKNLCDGLFLFSMGMFKKVFIADSIATFVNTGYGLPLEHFSMGEAWLISLSYTFQLYFDFSGYCDMAMGLGRMFNIHLPLNFDAPYRSANMGEFWRRWHMTLNRFLTKYLYIPLGGSRAGKFRSYVNILIVFLVSGIWHGAGWTFILWGVLHGVGVAVNRWWKRSGFAMPRWMGIALTFFIVNVLWVLFRADNMHQAWVIIRSMFDNTQLALGEDFTSHLSSIFQNRYNMLILLVAMPLSVFGPTAYQLMTDYGWYKVKAAATVILFAVSILFLTRVSTFLYFNF